MISTTVIGARYGTAHAPGHDPSDSGRPDCTGRVEGILIGLAEGAELRCRPSRRQKWAEKEMVLCVLHAVSIRVFPPAAAQISRLPGTKLCLAVGQELEPPVHWQRVFDDECVVVQALARYEDYPWCAVAES